MPPLIDDNNDNNKPTASDKKPPAKRLFYAVRKCEALKAPAIFLDWDDCCFYVNIKENDGPVDYQTFDVITDAFKYMTYVPAASLPSSNPKDLWLARKSDHQSKAITSAEKDYMSRCCSLFSQNDLLVRLPSLHHWAE